MSANSPAGKGTLRLEISRDHFTAYLHVLPKTEVSIEDIKELLVREKIVYGIKDEEKIGVFINNMELYDYTLVIASGSPFSHGRDAEIIFNFEKDSRGALVPELTDRDRVDFRSIGTIASVKKGDVIAKKIPAEQGTEGITIYGQKLPGEWGMDVVLKPGTNVSLSTGGTEYVAEIGGAPIISKGQLRVDPVFIVEGDVDYNTGNITFDGTVAVKGSVMDGFEINARGDVIVENTIQSARISAGGDVIVKRGILTRGKGLVSAEGNIYAKFIENSMVEAEGNIIVENAILNSQVYSNGRVIALTEEGVIIGGQTFSFDRVIARNIGSKAHPATYIQAGYRFDVQRKYIEQLAKLRALQKKMIEVQKNYEYASKTSASDIDKLGELRTKLLKMDRVKKQMQEDIYEINATRIFNNLAMVEVEQITYPGASIFIGDACYNVKKETNYSSFKWDIDQKMLYLSSYDESGRELRQDAKSRAKTVLIIDDSKAVRKTLQLIFTKMGLRVCDEAEDGEIGVEKYKKYRPSLVTCDIAMVNLDGLQTLRAIRKENSKAKIIMISSIKDRNKVLDCVVSGAFDYILKPFVPGRVITVVKGALES